MSKLRAIITDFDGTLVNTFTANLAAYTQAFSSVGYELDNHIYRKCFGLRFDELCKEVGVTDPVHINKIKELKKKIYPQYFTYCELNKDLFNFIKYSKGQGVLTCIASTAAKENLFNVMQYHNLKPYFDIVISGEDVSKGKPDPEVYLKALNLLECDPEEALIFEDSDIGCEAAEAAGIKYIQIKNFYI